MNNSQLFPLIMQKALLLHIKRDGPKILCSAEIKLGFVLGQIERNFEFSAGADNFTMCKASCTVHLLQLICSKSRDRCFLLLVKSNFLSQLSTF